MGAQDNTEKVLRSLHVLLSKSEPYPKEPSKVIVDKQQVLDLLSDLNKCMYQIMDEYELTKRSRDKAEREFRKQGDQIIWDASRKAEDIYAASVMYMDEALNHMRQIVSEAQSDVSKIYTEVNQQMQKEQHRIKENQLELKSQLQDLVDTEKYLHLIEDRNREIEKAKNEGKPEAKEEKAIYANRQTEIKVNQEYLDKLGMSVVDETEKEVAADTAPAQSEPDEELKQLQAEIRVNLDADYFQWKEDQQKAKTKSTDSSAKKPVRDNKTRDKSRSSSAKDSGNRDKSEGIPKVFKNLIGGHQHDDSGM